MRVPLMYRAWRPAAEERGAAAILTAILITVLIGFMAFVTDFGMAYANKRGLQNGADSAALAVAQKIALQGSPTASCAQLATVWDNPSSRAVAEDYFGRNRPGGDSAINHFDLVCVDDGKQLVVEVGTAQNSPSFFGTLFGQDDVDIEQEAKAVVAPAKSVMGLRPFGVCKGVADQIIAVPMGNHTIGLNNIDFGCGGAPGNWGIIDFNGGSNPTGEAIDWILNGYNGPISNSPPLNFSGQPGAPNPGAFEAAMNSVLDDEIAIPVYDQLTMSGGNAQFRIMGFLAIKICGWKFNNRNGQGSCFDPLVVPVPVPQNYLQIRYNAFIPFTDGATNCTIGNFACDLGTRTFKLAD
ncbi:MAG: hypothetical protein H0W95_05370 [Nocardioidaceae bacterium]|nr:hypothetical protein [Nocardioidaceae bacterium]